jgi:hypothetical protein
MVLAGGSGPPSRAITGFQNLMKESPSSGGYYLLACGLQKESRHIEAVEAFRESLRLGDSGSADLYHTTASVVRS